MAIVEFVCKICIGIGWRDPIEEGLQVWVGGRLVQTPVTNQQQQHLGDWVGINDRRAGNGDLEPDRPEEIQVNAAATMHGPITGEQPIDRNASGRDSGSISERSASPGA